MDTVLEARRLTKLYRNGRGVRDVSFDIRRGDIFGLLGLNGSGKTTVLKLVTGLTRPDGGSVRLFGRDLTDSFEAAMRPVGCVVETADAYDYMSGRDHLRMAARFYPGLPESRVDESLEWVGLTPYAREKARGYSLGMKQRLALAAALIGDPELVVLDEPTNGLDIEGIAELRELILRLSEQRGTTFLISSHMIGEMERICTRVGIMSGGALAREGTIGELTDGRSLEQACLTERTPVQGGGGYA